MACYNLAPVIRVLPRISYETYREESHHRAGVAVHLQCRCQGNTSSGRLHRQNDHSIIHRRIFRQLPLSVQLCAKRQSLRQTKCLQPGWRIRAALLQGRCHAGNDQRISSPLEGLTAQPRDGPALTCRSALARERPEQAPYQQPCVATVRCQKIPTSAPYMADS